jgi:hypothetical protein
MVAAVVEAVSVGMIDGLASMMTVLADVEVSSFWAV